MNKINNQIRREEFNKRREYKGSSSFCNAYECPVFQNCLLDINNLQQENKKYKEVIDKAVEWVADYKDQWIRNDEVVDDMNILLDILKEVK